MDRLAEAEKVLVGEKMALQRDLEVAMGVLDKLDADMDLFIKVSFKRVYID